MNRVPSVPVHGSRYFRSTVCASSPDTDRRRSVMVATSAFLDSRASDTIASGRPIRGDSPKLVPRLASVGEAWLPLPTRAASTRAMVPFPDRGGPTSKRIFCRSVRPDST